MDIEGLFGPAKQDTNTITTQVRNISLVSYLNSKPLVYGMENNLVEHNFNILKDVPSVCSRRLIEGEVELGIIPSIEYVHGKGSWKIVPDVCISSGVRVKSVMLFFKADLKEIKTIALDTSSRTSVALLKILLNEKYQISPEFIVMQPDLPAMLEKADAALIIGDKALHYQDEYPLSLDLGEEWFDMTGLPFVYAFWAGQDFALNSDDIDVIIKSKEIGLQNIDEISKEFAKSNPKDWRFYRDYLTNNILYGFGEKEKEGLNEFYHYAFYLGLIEHIPELHFYER